MTSPIKKMAKLEPRTKHEPRIGHEKNPKGYEISQKTLDQSTQPRNQGSRIMARNGWGTDWIGYERLDWIGPIGKNSKEFNMWT